MFPPIVEEVFGEDRKRLKDKVVLFNPGSRQQTARRLQGVTVKLVSTKRRKGMSRWMMKSLRSLVKNTRKLSFLLNTKRSTRAGSFEGKEAWLTHSRVFDDSRIHGTVITNACISGRCSHRRPNMAQIPVLDISMGRNVDLYSLLLWVGFLSVLTQVAWSLGHLVLDCTLMAVNMQSLLVLRDLIFSTHNNSVIWYLRWTR